MVMEYHNNKISVDEICRKYDINRYTYYKRRKEIIQTALSFLMLHLENYGEEYYNLKKENQSLRRKVRELEKEKAVLESKYNWIYYHLNAEQHDTDILAQIKPGP